MTTERVADRGGHEAYRTVLAETFDLSPDAAGRLLPSSLVTANSLTVLIGRVDGAPVAAGSLFQPDEVAGVYTVAVVDEYRRNGFGEAMTRAVLRTGRASGAWTGALQATTVGLPLYEHMGFETAVTYERFRPV